MGLLNKIQEDLGFTPFNDHFTYLCSPESGCYRVDKDKKMEGWVDFYDACHWSSGVSFEEATIFSARTYEEFEFKYFKFLVKEGNVSNLRVEYLRETLKKEEIQLVKEYLIDAKHCFCLKKSTPQYLYFDVDYLENSLILHADQIITVGRLIEQKDNIYAYKHNHYSFIQDNPINVGDKVLMLGKTNK